MTVKRLTATALTFVAFGAATAAPAAQAADTISGGNAPTQAGKPKPKPKPKPAPAPRPSSPSDIYISIDPVNGESRDV